jgi:hypothetical protein
MIKLSNEDLHANYKQQALKIMIKYEEPSLDQVYHQVCLRDNCPVGRCDFLLGFKEGKQCNHVLKVKRLVDNLVDIVNRY